MTGIQQVLASGGGSVASLMGIISSLGLTSNIVYCLDAGDPASYAGSGQTWSDVSGQGNHFVRGRTSAVEATVDPTFNGVVGALNETNYWTNPSTGLFTAATSPSTFDDAWAKNNGAVTIVTIFQTGGGFAGLAGDLQTDVSHGGCGLFLNISNQLQFNFNINDASTGAATRFTSSATFTTGVLQFAALAFDEATTSGILQINSTQETSGALSACSGVKNPPRDWLVGDEGFNDFMPTRLYAAAAWSTKLTTTQLSSLYTSLKANRFTSLP